MSKTILFYGSECSWVSVENCLRLIDSTLIHNIRSTGQEKSPITGSHCMEKRHEPVLGPAE